MDEDDEIFAITSAGGVVRTEVNQIRPSSRATMGVRLVNLADDVELLAIDRNVEDDGEEDAQAVAKGEKSVEDVQQEHLKLGDDATAKGADKDSNQDTTEGEE